MVAEIGFQAIRGSDRRAVGTDDVDSPWNASQTYENASWISKPALKGVR
jgi:hypothetical protein